MTKIYKLFYRIFQLRQTNENTLIWNKIWICIINTQNIQPLLKLLEILVTFFVMNKGSQMLIKTIEKNNFKKIT